MLRRILYALVPLAVLLAFSILACLLGYFLIQLFGDRFTLAKLISKTTLLFLVLSLFSAMAWLNIGRNELGLAGGKTLVRQILQGFALGFLTLLPVLGAECLLGIQSLDPAKQWTWVTLAQKAGLTLLLSLLISWIEEPLFRGLLIAALRRRMSVAAAVAVSGIYYASLHFLHSHSEIPSDQVTFFTGFGLLAEAFGNLFSLAILPDWLALLAVGLLMGLVRTRSATNLGFCIGCHSAWVWQIKMAKSLFVTEHGAGFGYLVGYYDGVIGWLVAVWLGSGLVGYGLWHRFRGR